MGVLLTVGFRGELGDNRSRKGAVLDEMLDGWRALRSGGRSLGVHQLLYGRCRRHEAQSRVAVVLAGDLDHAAALSKSKRAVAAGPSGVEPMESGS